MAFLQLFRTPGINFPTLPFYVCLLTLFCLFQIHREKTTPTGSTQTPTAILGNSEQLNTGWPFTYPGEKIFRLQHLRPQD